MPFIVGHVTQQGAPCLDFQVECVNKPISNFTYAPPYFWITVPQDEYVLEVTSSTGESGSAVAKALTTFGGVRLSIPVA